MGRAALVAKHLENNVSQPSRRAQQRAALCPTAAWTDRGLDRPRRRPRTAPPTTPPSRPLIARSRRARTVYASRLRRNRMREQRARQPRQATRPPAALRWCSTRTWPSSVGRSMVRT
eukprot:5772935-Prymnesium_polylepis.1